MIMSGYLLKFASFSPVVAVWGPSVLQAGVSIVADDALVKSTKIHDIVTDTSIVERSCFPQSIYRWVSARKT